MAGITALAMDRLPLEHPTRISAIVLTTALLLGLHILLGVVVRPFILPLLWSTVLAVSTWPLYARARALVPNRPWVAALGLSLLLGAVLLAVAIPLPLELAGELHLLGSNISSLNIETTIHSMRDVPLVGEMLAEQLSALLHDEQGLKSLLASHQAELVRFATQAAKGAINTVTVTIMALAGCYILYLHGEGVIAEAIAIMKRLGSQRAEYLVGYIGATVRGAAYSVIATAIAQGTLAGIGYSIAGAPLPLLLALCTMVFSLIPFGAPLLYVPISAYLLFGSGLPWYHGVGLLVWGIVVVSTVDNFLRSVLISQATQVSPVIVFIGVVGGVLSFGLLGVFIGPAIIGIATTLWRDFAEGT